jgi:hypothetical protein
MSDEPFHPDFLVALGIRMRAQMVYVMAEAFIAGHKTHHFTFETAGERLGISGEEFRAMMTLEAQGNEDTEILAGLFEALGQRLEFNLISLDEGSPWHRDGSGI